MVDQLNLFDPKEKRGDAVTIETVMDKISFRKALTIDNLSHNMLIHGYLRAVHDYIFDFGLENTAAFIISRSGICKEDFIRCQLETEWNNEIMLAIIEKAFLKNPDDEIVENIKSLTYEDRIKAIHARSMEKKSYNNKYVLKGGFNYQYFVDRINKRKKK